MTPTRLALRLPIDPRDYQIAALSGLLGYGMTRLEFGIGPAQALATLAAALATQWVCTRAARLPAFDPRSALISGLSLCLLLRTNHVALAMLAAAIAIASKFTLRWNGRHVFNPTNFGIIVTLLATRAVWVSPGQWGAATTLAFAIACAGSVVVTRASRADVTFAFLGAWLALHLGYSRWLGQPPAIPLHRFENGALLLFAFFMISDPRTTPETRRGRVVFAVLVAAVALFIQLGLYRTNGLLWSLVLLSPLVPVLNRLWPGPRYEWTRGTPSPPPHPSEARHETPAPRRLAPARALAAVRD